MTRKTEDKVFFYEVQRFRQLWLWLLVGSIEVILSLILYRQIYLRIQVGNFHALDVGLWAILLLVCVATPIHLLIFKMVTEVTKEKIIIKFFPVVREYCFEDILSFKMKQYNPFNYGRLGTWWNGALVVSGNYGIELEFKNGEKMLIGSQYTEELVQAIESAMRR